jgi:glycosyltransferase involved in cell wall biosynthesis
MRIFIPLEVYYPSQAGGPANQLYWLCRALVRRGFETVVTASNKGVPAEVPLNKWLEYGGRAIYVKTFWVHFPLRQTLLSFREVIKADVVHTSSIFYPAAAASAFLAALLGKKQVISPQNELSDWSLARSRFRKFPFSIASKLLLRKATFVATSEEEIGEIKRFFGQDAKVILLPYYMEVPPQIERRVGERYLLFIGRLHQKKGIDNLLHAAARSRAFLASDVVLKIAGRSYLGYEQELKALVDELGLGEKVHFIGQVEGETKERVLADAEWMLMPSFTENFGIVVIESLAQGTPVVASTGTPWKSLEDERAGFWTGNDPDTLAAKIDELLAMPAGDYAGYRTRARTFVENHFDIEQNIDKWIDLYKSL